MKKTLVASLIAGALLAPSIPALQADAAPAPATTITQSTAKSELAELDAAINTLQAADEALEGTNYAKEFKELLKTALELRGAVTTIATGGVPDVDLATITPRIELVVQIAETIDTATSTLQTKVQAAHVELGFAVTKAVIRVINPGATIEQINASKKELADDLARVSTYPDLQPGDTATIYVKAGLDKKIWETRVKRDKEILGKADSEVYFELNRNITHAVGVWFNPKATVADVTTEGEHLDAAYDKAAATLQ